MSKEHIVIMPGALDDALDLPKDTRAKIVKTLDALSRGHDAGGLRTKKIKANSRSVFECRVDDSVRLIFDFKGSMIRCWYIGAHDAALAFGERLKGGPETRVYVEEIVTNLLPRSMDQLVKFLLEEAHSEGVLVSIEDIQCRLGGV